MATAAEAAHQLESLFQAHYPRVARTIINVIRDPARAEELAVEVFLRWPRLHPPARPEAWLYRTAVHVAVDELRRRARHQRFEHWMAFLRPAAVRPPDEAWRITQSLARLSRRDAKLLALDAEGFSYAEIAAALSINPASVGTLLARARQAFKKEYGEP